MPSTQHKHQRCADWSLDSFVAAQNKTRALRWHRPKTSKHATLAQQQPGVLPTPPATTAIDNRWHQRLQCPCSPPGVHPQKRSRTSMSHPAAADVDPALPWRFLTLSTPLQVIPDGSLPRDNSLLPCPRVAPASSPAWQAHSVWSCTTPETAKRRERAHQKTQNITPDDITWPRGYTQSRTEQQQAARPQCTFSTIEHSLQTPPHTARGSDPQSHTHTPTHTHTHPHSSCAGCQR